MIIYVGKDYQDVSRKAANIMSAQIIMKPNAVLGLATASTPVALYKQAYNMGIKRIMAAKKIRLVATGSAKADDLYKALYGPITPNVPASILQLHQDVTVVADEDALSLIKEKGLL